MMARYHWQRRRRRALMIMGGAAALLLLPLAYRIHLAQRNQRMFEEIRGKGLPVTLEELEAWYPAVPAEENAALEYMRAVEKLRELPPEEMDTIPGTAHGPALAESAVYSDEALAALKRWLDMNAETLAALHAAGSKNQSRYPVDFTTGFSAELPHLALLRNGARLLRSGAIFAALNNDSAHAMQDICDTLRMARSLQNEPGLISQLVRIAILGIARDGFMEVLSRTNVPAETLLEVQDALRETYAPEACRKAYVGDRCLAILTFENLETHPSLALAKEEHPAARGLSVLSVALGMLDANLYHMLKSYEIILNGLERPFPDALATGAEVERYIQGCNRFTSLLTSILIPAMGKSVAAFARDKATFHLMETAIAIERYRIANRKLPESLDSLTPAYLDAVPEDPFDGAPLRYIRNNPGYVLYSVGDNRVDDRAAVEETQRGAPRELDWVFRVAR